MPPAPPRSTPLALLAGVLAWGAVTAPGVAQTTGTGTTGGSSGERSSRNTFPGDFPQGDFQQAMPQPVFFPPSPPPLGRSLPAAAGAGNSGRFAAPAELAGFINELFYPQLGVRLASGTLTPKLRAQLDRYRAEKLALQNELRAEIDRLRPVPPAERTAAFAALAAKQAARLAALEADAETLRRDLYIGDRAWGALRQWRLGDGDRRGYSPVEIAQVMRAFAYYENGLTAAQRRLLREIALELINATDTAANAAAAQPYVFFPPEPARVLIPDDVPGDVAAQIAVYETRKSVLKKELYDTVYARDNQSFTFLRANPLKTLADNHAARLDELETLAEEIRRGLARTGEPETVTERSPLSLAQQADVIAWLRRAADAQRTAAEKVEAVAAENRGQGIAVTYRFDYDGLKFNVGQSRGGRGGAPTPEVIARASAVHAQVAAIAEDYSQQLNDLIKQRDDLRAEIGRALKLTGPAADRAFATAVRVTSARETEAGYRDYRVAVFQPGLSAAQRRILFDAVIEQLNLPLPRGELQPTRRSPTW
jgi:hypothetical protein